MLDFDLFWYKGWYKERVSGALSPEEKLEVAKQISEISLLQPINLPGIDIKKENIPLLANLTQVEQYSGRMLMVAYFCIARDLGLPVGDFLYM